MLKKSQIYYLAREPFPKMSKNKSLFSDFMKDSRQNKIETKFAPAFPVSLLKLIFVPTLKTFHYIPEEKHCHE